MKLAVVLLVVFAIGPLAAQEEKKPVPKDSVRVFVPGCSKGYVFTAGRRTEDEPAGAPIPEGMHLRMGGPKKLMAEIKAQEGTRIEITGVMKKGQVGDGISVGHGVHVSGGAPSAGSGMGAPGGNQSMIDVEGWRQLPGSCPSR
jgi:hypothetical protein